MQDTNSKCTEEEPKVLTHLYHQEDVFKEKVRVLLSEIENSIDDENWEKISVKAWNAVSCEL